MAGIPWDRWMYHLDYKAGEVNRLHQSAVSDMNYILDNHAKANTRTDQLQKLTSQNQLLSIVVTYASLPDLNLTDAKTKVDALPSAPLGFLPADIGSMITEFIGGSILMKAVWRFGVGMTKFIPVEVRRGFSRVMPNFTKMAAPLTTAAKRAGTTETSDPGIRESTGGGELEEVPGPPPPVEAPIGTQTNELTGEKVGPNVAEEVTAGQFFRASLREFVGMGIGLAVAIGIDVACAAISGKTESDQLDAEIEKLRTASKKIGAAKKSFDDRIAAAEEQIYQQQKIMIAFIDELSKHFNTSPEGIRPVPNKDHIDDNMAYFLSYAKATSQHFAFFYTLRTLWLNAHTVNPEMTKQQFVTNVKMFSPGVSETRINQVFDWCAKHSVSMQRAAA